MLARHMRPRLLFVETQRDQDAGAAPDRVHASLQGEFDRSVALGSRLHPDVADPQARRLRNHLVADDGCSFRLGKPSKVPLQVGKDWAETSASFLQFTPGQWYHLAATFQRPHVRTYVNGKAVASAAWDYPIGFSGDLQIGIWGDPQACHHGLIDEVKLYNRALTPEEVLADFQRTAAGRGPAGPGEQAYAKIAAQAAVPAVTLDNDLTRLLLDARGRVIRMSTRR